MQLVSIKANKWIAHSNLIIQLRYFFQIYSDAF